MKHDYSTDQFQAFSAGGVRKFLGPGSLAHPNPRVRALLGARAIDVALFFGGGPFLRLRPKRALQERRKSGAFSERCNCKPAQIITRRPLCVCLPWP
jgi:hypothetical protein